MSTFTVVAISRNTDKPVAITGEYSSMVHAQHVADGLSYEDWTGPNEYYYTVWSDPPADLKLK